MNGKPFDYLFDDFILIPNVIFDHIMPALSSDGWKVLCVALRQAWKNDRQTSQITPDQFREKSGIETHPVVEQAIEECVNAGYLARHVIGQHAQSDSPQYAYALNTNFEITATANPPPPAQKKPTGIVATLSPERENAFQTLMSLGQEMGIDPDPEEARELAMLNDASAVLSWIDTGREMVHLNPPARFETVMQRLRDRVPPVPKFVLPPDAPEDTAQKAATPPPTEPEPDPAAAEQLWEAALEELRPKVRKSQFKWFKPTQGIALTGDRLTVSVSSKRTKEWLEEGQFTKDIQEAVASVAGRPIELKFEISS